MYAGEYRRMYIECSIGLYVCRKDGTGSERKCNRFSAGAVGNGVGTAYVFLSAGYYCQIQAFCL